MKLFVFTIRLLFLAAPCLVFSQTDPDAWLKRYPHENAVVLKDEQVVTIESSSGSLDITAQSHKEILYLTDKAHFYNNDKVYYSYFSELKSISAETIVPDGEKTKTLEVKKFEDAGETSAGIFYDDVMSRNFYYPGLTKGARSVLNYTKKVTDPHLLPAFFFSSNFPVAVSRLVIRTSPGVKIRHKLFNVAGVNIKYTTQQVGEYTEHAWESVEIKSHPSEPGAPPARYYIPHIIYHIESYTTGGKEIPVLRTVADLHQWDYNFVKKSIAEKSPVLKALADSITAGAATESEKAKRIYYWVQDKIKYVAFEDGLRGFTPSTPSMVCDKRYGDCKDMASLLNALLGHAELKSHLVTLGSRNIPYKYSEVPVPAVADHMIAAVEIKGELIFLDATSSYTAFGFPSAFIMGKEALVAIDSVKYKVVTVPVVSKDKSALIDSTWFTLEGKKVTGKGSLYMTGYMKARNTSSVKEKRKEDLDKLMHRFLQKGNNKYKTISYTIANVEDKDKPLHFDYSFAVDDYATIAGDEIYINLNLDKYTYMSAVDAAKNVLPRDNDYCFTKTSVNTLQIPQGYKIEELPQNSSYSNELFGFSIQYRVTGSTVIITSTVSINYLLLTPDKFPAWNEMAKQLAASYRETLTLKQQQ